MKRRINYQTIILILFVLLFIPALWRCGPNPIRLDSNPPIILISIDTLRSDRLPYYGYTAGHTPHLDQFGTESIGFENAFSHIPLTLPSHASLFTGLLPPEHGIRDNIGYQLEPNHQTLVEYLSAKGYHAAGFVSAMVLRQETGISQGFQHYDDRMAFRGMEGIHSLSERSGGITLERCLSYLDSGKNLDLPFLFLHLFDPHAPYHVPDDFKPTVQDPYDQEIEYVDSLLGSFFARLKQKDLYERALIIVLSDHGEGLGDHGEMQHGLTLYRETIQVPLLIKLPNGQKAGTRISENVGLVDLSNTIKALLGDELAGPGRPILLQEPLDSGRMVTAETLSPALNYGAVEARSVIVEDLHAISSFENHVYRFRQDSKETENLFSHNGFPKEARSYLLSAEPELTRTNSMSQEDLEQLRSLGYTSGSDLNAESAEMTEADFLGIIRMLAESNHQIEIGIHDGIVEYMTGLIEKHPGLLDAYLILGKSLIGQNRFEEARNVLVRGLERSASNLSMHLALADLEFRAQHRDRGEKLCQRILELAPDLGPGTLLPLLYRRDIFPLAEIMASKVLQSYPESGLGLVTLARGQTVAGKFAEAEKTIAQAMTLAEMGSETNLLAELHFLHADLMAQQNQAQASIQSFRSALQVDPGHLKANTRFALLLAAIGRKDEAISQLETWTRGFPRPDYLEHAANIAKLIGRPADAERFKPSN